MESYTIERWAGRALGGESRDGFVGRVSIKDGGVPPDVVTLRLLRGAAMMSASAEGGT